MKHQRNGVTGCCPNCHNDFVIEPEAIAEKVTIRYNMANAHEVYAELTCTNCEGVLWAPISKGLASSLCDGKTKIEGFSGKRGPLEEATYILLKHDKCSGGPVSVQNVTLHINSGAFAPDSVNAECPKCGDQLSDRDVTHKTSDLLRRSGATTVIREWLMSPFAKRPSEQPHLDFAPVARCYLRTPVILDLVAEEKLLEIFQERAAAETVWDLASLEN